MLKQEKHKPLYIKKNYLFHRYFFRSHISWILCFTNSSIPSKLLISLNTSWYISSLVLFIFYQKSVKPTWFWLLFFLLFSCLQEWFCKSLNAHSFLRKTLWLALKFTEPCVCSKTSRKELLGSSFRVLLRLFRQQTEARKRFFLFPCGLF